MAVSPPAGAMEAMVRGLLPVFWKVKVWTALVLPTMVFGKLTVLMLGVPMAEVTAKLWLTDGAGE